MNRRVALIAAVGALLATLIWSIFQNRPAPSVGWALIDSAEANLTTLDPIQAVDAFTLNVLSHVYDGLVRIAPDGKVVPGLAERWQVSPDGLTWTFVLRKGTRFHEVPKACGMPTPAEVSADDVVYSLNRGLFAPFSLYKWVLGDLLYGDAPPESGPKSSHITALDRYTVEVRLAKPFALPPRLAMTAAGVYPMQIEEKCGEKFLSRSEVGTGPYRITAAVPDDVIRLERFNSVQQGGAGPDRIEIKAVSHPQAAIEAFRRGELDVIDLNLGTFAQADALSKSGGHTLKALTTNSLDYLVLNNNVAPFDDERIRKAINLAIDRQQLSQVMSGALSPAFGYIPPPSPAYQGDDALRKAQRFDTAAAAALLAEYRKEKPIPPLELVVDAGELPETIGAFVQSSLKQNLGLNVRLKVVSWPELLQLAFSGKGHFHRFWWNVVTPNEDIYFQFFFPGKAPPQGFNVSHYNSQPFLALYWAAMREQNQLQHLKGMRELERLLIDDAVAVPLGHRISRYMVRKGISLEIDGLARKHYENARRSQ